MTTDRQSASSSWDERYQRQAVEQMPWFYPELDDDLKQALDQLELREGRLLDLGTGPGTQAMQLARRGFAVTAVDLSDTAIQRARDEASAQGLSINWHQDDILATRLAEPFDMIFDRGCFHVLLPELREKYVNTVVNLLKPGGWFFLKTFSHLQPGTQGPNRFTPEQIRAIFGDQLHIHSITETVYQGTLDPLPRALFCVMQRTG